MASSQDICDSQRRNQGDGENPEQNSVLSRQHDRPLPAPMPDPEHGLPPGSGSGDWQRATVMMMMSDPVVSEGRLKCDDGCSSDESDQDHRQPEHHQQHQHHQHHHQPSPGDGGVVVRVSGRTDSISSRESLDSSDRVSRSSIVDDLLFEIYDRWNYTSRRYSYDSDTTYTGYSSTSDAFFYRSDSVQSAFDDKHSTLYPRKYLQSKGKLIALLIP